jgi:hypothetical protein
MTGDRETAAVAGQSGSDAATDLAAQGCARRAFILGAAGASLAAGGWISRAEPARAAESPRAASALFAYIGCFTSAQRNARAKGISVYRIDQTGTWALVQTLETVPNPQFIAFDRQRKFLYSVHGDGTDVSSYAIDKPSGRITFLNKQPTSGNNSTHLTPDPSNRYIVIGNGPGVAVFPINRDGSLAPYTDMVPAQGEVGPHRNHPVRRKRRPMAWMDGMRGGGDRRRGGSLRIHSARVCRSKHPAGKCESCRRRGQAQPEIGRWDRTRHNAGAGRLRFIRPSRLTPGIPNAAS